MKTLKKYRAECMIAILAALQCGSLFYPNMLPQWIYTADLILLILFIIMMKLNQMENNLKNRC